MIGIFDSGLGGLTVYKAIKNLLPDYDYLYLGDTAHLPYGNRSEKNIYELSQKACDFLFKQGCELIIIACNSATAKALRRLQKEYLQGRQGNESEKILGVVRPIAENIQELKKQKVGLIGTRATINSNIYQEELERLNWQGNFLTKATPLLVPLIEENYFKRPETTKILRNYLREFKKQKIQSLILGCTHYPLLIKQIRGIMGKACLVPDPSDIVAKSLQDYLIRHPEIEKNITKNKKTRFLVTDLTDNFQLLANKFLNKKVEIQLISF